MDKKKGIFPSPSRMKLSKNSLPKLLSDKSLPHQAHCQALAAMGIHLRSAAKQIFTARKNEKHRKRLQRIAQMMQQHSRRKAIILNAPLLARAKRWERERERAALSNFNNPTSAENEWVANAHEAKKKGDSHSQSDTHARPYSSPHLPATHYQCFFIRQPQNTHIACTHWGWRANRKSPILLLLSARASSHALPQGDVEKFPGTKGQRICTTEVSRQGGWPWRLMHWV